MLVRSRMCGYWAMVALAAFLSFAGQVAAQDAFPSKPIRVIVGESAGTSTDVVARILSPGMSAILGQPLVVDYKVGGGGLIPQEYMARQAPADGYTIMSVSVTSLAMLPVTNKEVRFDPLTEIPPFIGLAEGPLILGSAPHFPWKSFDELVANARANPGKLNYGASSAPVRLPMLMVLQEKGLDVVHIPYSAGADFIKATITGDVHMGFFGLGLTLAQGEKFRPLAISGAKRNPRLPDVPTFAELGIPQLPGVAYSLNAPAKVPKPALDKLTDAAARTMNDPEVRARFAKIAMDVQVEPGDVAAKKLLAMGRSFAAIAKKAGIQPQ